MAKFSEDILTGFTRPPSDHEESKLANSERMVREAINEDPELNRMSIKVFGQGSYANDTNVRLNSDIDINVRLNDVFFYELPSGKNPLDYGLNSPNNYAFSTYKQAVENALVRKFGRSCVKREDKCLFVEGNSYRVDTDVVPTFRYKYFYSSGGNKEGVKLIADSGKSVVNYPLQHIDNGTIKNSETSKRFKRLTRIYRRVRYKMLDDNIAVSDNITSFLLECLVWNVPNYIFNGNQTWTDRLKSSIGHLYANTKEQEKCKDWTEVSKELYLFHSGRKWSHSDVNNFLIQMWNYLEY